MNFGQVMLRFLIFKKKKNAKKTKKVEKMYLIFLTSGLGLVLLLAAAA